MLRPDYQQLSSRSYQNNFTFGIGLSCFYELIVTLLKLRILKQELKIVSHRGYKRFSNNSFPTKYKLTNLTIRNTEYDKEILNKYASVEQKFVKANQEGLRTKELNGKIMKRSKLS